MKNKPSMMKLFVLKALSFTLAMLVVPESMAACIVVGPPTSQIQTSEGLVRPVASVRHCESMRLKRGPATALWTTATGDARASDIRADGPPLGYPVGVPDEANRGLMAVYQAMTGSGVQYRAGYRRSESVADAAEVFVGSSGLELPWVGPGEMVIKSVRGRAEEVIASISVPEAQRAVLLPAAALPSAVVKLEFKHADGIRRLWLRRLTDAREGDVAAALPTSAMAGKLNSKEISILRAMVFQHFGLTINRDVELRGHQ